MGPVRQEKAAARLFLFAPNGSHAPTRTRMKAVLLAKCRLRPICDKMHTQSPGEITCDILRPQCA